jgi:hypothetical protein
VCVRVSSFLPCFADGRQWGIIGLEEGWFLALNFVVGDLETKVVT